MDTKFQLWLMEHQPDAKMLWKSSFWDTYVFWRDTIIPMFNERERTWDEWGMVVNDIDSYTDVVGQHMSKSIVNPVLRITYKGTEVVIRYNFYDYEIAVVGSVPVSIPMKGLFSSQDTSFFYQGFPKGYVLNERYEDNQCKFMASLGNHYQFYTFMFLLKTELDKKR